MIDQPDSDCEGVALLQTAARANSSVVCLSILLGFCMLCWQKCSHAKSVFKYSRVLKGEQAQREMPVSGLQL